jgi:molecular chaperone Hsp33
MVQRMPERSAGSAEDDDDWHRVGVLMGSLTQSELLDPALAPGDLLYRLFHEDGVRVYRRRPLGFRCRCSRQRVERMLVALPEDDLMALADDRRVTVTCEFCKAAYVFGLRDLKALRPSPA